MRVHTLVGAALVALAAASQLGCSERPQERGYRGKPDANPWDSEPTASLYTTSKWARGDKASWENALKQRASSQNEYNRMR